MGMILSMKDTNCIMNDRNCEQEKSVRFFRSKNVGRQMKVTAAGATGGAQDTTEPRPERSGVV